MNIYIKNMVSFRCQVSVRKILDAYGLLYGQVGLGEVEILSMDFSNYVERLKNSLLIAGFELLEDKKSILIERVKTTIIQMVHYEDDLPRSNFSVHISEQLGYDYTYLANIFSQVKGISIEQFIIMHRIERVKELLGYDELSLLKIAEKLNYRAVSHLCHQFKKITGMTPTEYKSMKHRVRNNLEDL